MKPKPKKRKKKTAPRWDLPDWHVPILLNALTDHELVLKLRDQGGYGYRVILDQIRQNLQEKAAPALAPETPE